MKDTAMELTEESFETEVLRSEGIVIVEFYGRNCPPCKTMEPLVDELAADEKFPNFFKLDTNKLQDIAARYGVRCVPTFLYFKHGEMMKRSVGVISRSDFTASVEKLRSQSDSDRKAGNFQVEFENLLANGDLPDALVALRKILERQPELATQEMTEIRKSYPLDFVVGQGYQACADLLVEFGAKLGLAELAALKRFDEALAYLERNPESLDQRCGRGAPPVFFAIVGGDVDLFDALLEKGADLTDVSNGNLVTWALRTLNFAFADKLVAAGVAVEEPERLPWLVDHLIRTLQQESKVAEALNFAFTHSENVLQWCSSDGKNLRDILIENGHESLLDERREPKSH